MAARLPSSRLAPHGWLDSGTKGRPLLYVTHDSDVDIFAADSHAKRPSLLGQITGLDTPSLVAVDADRDLYVLQANPGDPVLVFPPGSTTPSRELDVDGAWPAAIAIGRDGDVFVSTADQGPLALSVLVYRGSDTEPFTVLHGYFDGDFCMAVDGANDVFVMYFNFSKTSIGEFLAQRNQQWEQIGDLGFGDIQPNELAFDGSGNLATFEYAYANESWALVTYPPGSTTPTMSRFIQGWEVGSMAFNQSGTALYTGTGPVVELHYPDLSLIQTFPSGAAGGIAISPALLQTSRW